jgi:hypothetical protein
MASKFVLRTQRYLLGHLGSSLIFRECSTRNIVLLTKIMLTFGSYLFTIA